jgi:predicted ATPase/DNA-binding SARP family transcriptional activator
MVEVRVLGVVAVRRDEALIPVGAGKVAELLVRLALDAGVMVRTDRLIEDLWADKAHGTARNTLQAKVSQLRRALGVADLVAGSQAGYTLHVDRGAVDAFAVIDLAERATEFRRAGDLSSALDTSIEGLDFFGSEVLPGAGDGDWVIPHRQRLEEVRLDLLETKMASRLDLGHSGAVIGELESLVSEHPLREALWSSLIVALYRDNRQADALSAYARVRGQLAGELGLDPGPALQALEQKILQHDPSLDVPADTGSRRPHTNAPALTSPMIGRDADLEAVGTLLTQGRLVTIVGVAGVGKTRLATEVVRRAERPGGAWLVRLESANDAAAVLQAIVEVLDVVGSTEPLLIGHLRGAHVLLALDNCEQAVDAVADLVSRVLDAAPWVEILCTSQLPLGLDGETTYVLEPLAVEDSAHLFTRLATRHRAFLVLDGATATTIDELCVSLDGLPLAIELAAARARTLTVDEIARRLSDRFTLLTNPTSRLPERRRALGAAIGWSYDLLFPDDQRGLWALACFSGSASLSSLERVLDALDVPEASAIDVLSRLADRSLVTVDAHEGVVRYRLLESIRAFAFSRLQEAGCADLALRAHARWIADAAASAATGVRGPEQTTHLALTRTERSNIDGALAWSSVHDPALGLAIVNGFAWAWFVLGDRPLGTARVTRALMAADGDMDVVPADRVIALCHAAWLASGDVSRAHADAEQAMTIAKSVRDEGLCAVASAAFAFVLLQQARPREALEVLDGCPAVLHRLGRRWDEAAAWILTVHAALPLGDTSLAARACQSAEGIVLDLGDDWAAGHLHAAVGFLAQTERRFDDAAIHLRRAADASKRLGFPATESLHLATLGRILQQAGDPGGAIGALERAIDIGFEIKDMRVVSLARVRLGRVLRAQGDHDGAQAAMRAADAWFQASGGGEGATLAACLRAVMDAEEGAVDASDRLRTVLEDAQRRRDPEIEVLALDALARAHADARDDSAARTLLDRADQLMSAAQHLIGEADRLDAVHARQLLSS